MTGTAGIFAYEVGQSLLDKQTLLTDARPAAIRTILAHLVLCHSVINYCGRSARRDGELFDTRSPFGASSAELGKDEPTKAGQGAA